MLATHGVNAAQGWYGSSHGATSSTPMWNAASSPAFGHNHPYDSSSQSGSWQHQSATQNGATAHQTGSQMSHTLSSASPPGPQAGGGYIATGRKRKRLQRACVSCHKAKRRCDGGLPCSNCDFSGRTCSYSDAQGNVVPPTQRSCPPSAAPSAPSAAAPSNMPPPGHSGSPVMNMHARLHSSSSASMSSDHAPSQIVSSYAASAGAQSATPFYPQSEPRQISSIYSRTRATSSSDYARSPKSSLRSWSEGAECPPPTLEQRTSLIETFFRRMPPFNAIVDEASFSRDVTNDQVSPVLSYSVYALAARFQQSTYTGVPAWAAGEGYAQSARRMLHAEDAEGNSLLDTPTPTFATALATCLLSAHEFGMNRTVRAGIYINHCARLSRSLNVLSNRSDGHRNADASSQQLAQHTPRFVCVAAMLDAMIALVLGQAPAFSPNELTEARSAYSTDVLTSDETSRAFIRLFEITSLLTSAMEARRTGVAPVNDRTVSNWASQLPASARYDATNLGSASRALNENHDRRFMRPPTPSMSSMQAWIWTSTHVVAECTTFLLEEQTRPAALDNIKIIVDAMGEDCRRSPLVFLPLLVISAHVQSSTPEVARWWDVARTYWCLQPNATAHLVSLLQKATPTTSSFRLGSRSPPNKGSNIPALVLPSPAGYGLRRSPSAHSTPGLGSRPTLPASPPSSLRERDSAKLPRHHSSASGNFLPSLNRLPSLRLSPPFVNGDKSSQGDEQAASIGASSPSNSSVTGPSYESVSANTSSNGPRSHNQAPLSVLDGARNVWGPFAGSRDRDARKAFV
ncbi:hypothetical protein IE81DRAFT_133965 [Ceraceosorus guamensis]|uniref:Zn(2)-C6 fungal-type domain-containing protein n=1 Tax=Ceraceosorus guamensis TaxID=1522189 RepID=A0A316VXI0_9BASI|nr:hypothetical protein IE81DRAFT_133965 [Ceraceosorus guamensis]PWN42357.1 hypothetical protein IE81DRAFT_133965 [Ceraceosorus guamensis]